MRIKRDKQSSLGSKVLLVLAAVVAIAGASLGLAYFWQNAQDQIVPDILVSSEFDQPLSSLESEWMEEQEESLASQQEVGESGLEEPSSQEESEVSQPDEQETSLGTPPQDGAVPLSEKVDNAYFADALFIGDSLSTGIPLYQVAGSPDTVAVKGLGPLNITTEKVVVTKSGESLTVLEAAKAYGDKKKIYIMLGSNALWMEADSFAKAYRTFIDAVKEQYPQGSIYLQTLPPVTVNAKQVYPTADNDKIREFNLAIGQLAKTTGVHLVDVYSALVDAQGSLPLEASPNDGMHLSPEYYQKWFDYLKTHTVEGKGR